MLANFQIDGIIIRALEEDINYVDVTTDYLVPEQSTSHAEYLAKAEGVICGLKIASRVFELAGGNVKFGTALKDGDKVVYGDVIAEVTGDTGTILKAERTSLNFLQHLSGIATLTNRCAEIVKWNRAHIADTRKTIPGMRLLQKYAVMIGGGKNHRYNLSDAAMIKDNHIAFCGGITNAVKELRKKLGHTVKIQVEANNFNQFMEALDVGADSVLLDNMSCDDLAQAAAIASGKVLLEASGGITLDNLAEVARTGVDIISIGALTHSAKALDISLNIR